MTKLSHSFSSTSTFETCPKQFHEVRILKNVVYKPGAEALRGTKLHAKWEEALDNDFDVGPDYQFVLDYVRKFTGLKVAERKLAINHEFKPCDWFAPDVFYRAIVDVMIFNGDKIVTIDYKTGKYRPKPRQGQEQVLLAMLHFPHIQEGESIFLWTDAEPAPTRNTYHRVKDGKRMMEDILEIPNAIQASFDSDNWPEQKSGLCARHCPVVDCQYNGSR